MQIYWGLIQDLYDLDKFSVDDLAPAGRFLLRFAILKAWSGLQCTFK